MSINLTDELIAKTKKGKLASAKQVYLDGDQENLQQVGEKTHQLEQSIKDIAASGGASVASAVTYDNATSGMTSVTAQGAIDELAAKDAAQDTEIAKKANSSDVDSQMQTEQTRVNAELDKKFDKENVAQELGDSEDKVVSQYALPFRIEESPEWAYLIKDAEDHVLFGIQQDGSVEWQVGIPAPIRKRFEEIISSASGDKSKLTDAINTLKDELTASLQSYQQTTDAAISSLQDTKVDKEEGKSLIDDEVKQHFEVIENEEWFTLMTDAEDHILFGIKRDTGKPYFPLNEMYHVEQSPEFFALWKDAEDHILMGIRRDGEIVGEIHAVNALKKTIADILSNIDTLQSNVTSATDKINTVEKKVSTIDASLQELLNVFSLQENPEFLAVETDAESKMLAYTKNDGSHYAYNMKSETIPEEFSHIEDPEGRMAIETDAEQKILAYRDKDGVKHEHEEEVNTLHVSNLDLKDNSVNDIQSALIANGFNVKTPIDWSESSFIQIPEPRCARVNLITDKMPTAKSGMGKSGVTCDIPCYMEFWDMQGNYFKIPILLSAQGNSSMVFIKKNLAIDMFSDKGRSTSFSVKFGDWVAQDSYHLKAYYTDFFRGVGAVSYMLYDEMAKTREHSDDRPYKALFTSKYSVSDSGTETSVSELSKNLDTGAKCFPMGFPVIVYQNGDFYGVYSWQLKKHRDNMHQDKKTAEHIHLDGTLGSASIFGGSIDWTKFEVRNPKSLYMQAEAIIKGETTLKYNGDYPMEIMGEDSPSYDSSNKDMQRCASVKRYITDLSSRLNELQQAKSDGKSESEIKALIEKYFMVSFLIDYILDINLTGNGDSYDKNWQWTTYDGIKWVANPYDHDCVFGAIPNGNYLGVPGNQLFGNSMDIPTGWIFEYYMPEIKARWKDLRDNHIFDAKHISGLLNNWCNRIGYDTFVLEYEKWNESPCNRPSLINSEYWSLITVSVTAWNADLTYSEGNYVYVNDKTYRSAASENKGNNPVADDGTNWENVTYDSTKTYSQGDKCCYRKSSFHAFFCKKACVEQAPLTGSYNLTPQDLGHFDSIYRVENWITKRIEAMDKLLEYNV